MCKVFSIQMPSSCDYCSGHSLGRMLLLGQSRCTTSCTINVCKRFWFPAAIKAVLRITIKDYSRILNLKLLPASYS
jgi:hypothetical protein